MEHTNILFYLRNRKLLCFLQAIKLAFSKYTKKKRKIFFSSTSKKMSKM